MFVKKLPAFAFSFAETAPEGGGENEPADVESAPLEGDSTDEGTETEEAEDEAAEWDADRALAKLRKANAEAKSQRDKRKAAEAKAAAAGDAEQRAATAEAKLMRLEVAISNGLPLELATRLQGDTPEELTQDAETLLALIASKNPPTNRPKPNLLRGGSTPDEEVELDADAIVAKALGV